ncbi:glycoside hydrolase family 30 beta sandwich domain-containing protein [Clostridium oryzae]|uniref:Glycosyl hydrolase family 30 beta sandwich domain-containing protein n=1 Tax=Clostridium oryzae TaxID=1450648 RepID=A0A1V4IH82_9CLOT|nr:glycoside hydrolase family 30 beta sandwich domain-containing protein [Clostridium oryzae]OPJ59279.1 hypothetical protein CLORY_33650 [Clostridium oryzae]
MKHFSHSVRPGAKRIETEGDYDDSFIAFKNSDESIACLISNFRTERKEVRLKVGENGFNIKLDGSSIYSFII